MNTSKQSITAATLLPNWDLKNSGIVFALSGHIIGGYKRVSMNVSHFSKIWEEVEVCISK